MSAFRPLVRHGVSRISPLKLFLHRADNALIDRIFRRLQWPDITRFSATSSYTRELVLSYRERAWDVNKFLRNFVDHAIAFRGVLAFSGALVTGSQVIRFFDRDTPLVEEHLDIVTRVGGVVPLVLFLEGIGYKRAPAGPSTYRDACPILNHAFQLTSSSAFNEKGGATGIISVLEYTRPLHASYENYTRILIVVVVQSPVKHVMLSYHSSGVMNFISHREAVSMFPNNTFVKRTFYPSSREDLGPNWNPLWAQEYRDKGFRVLVNRRAAPVHLGRRFAKDHRSWVLEFVDSDLPSITREEGRSVYGPQNLSEEKFEIVWMSEVAWGARHWRMSVYEPKIFWYLVPTHVVV